MPGHKIISTGKLMGIPLPVGTLLTLVRLNPALSL
jgi:hypothetical protein